MKKLTELGIGKVGEIALTYGLSSNTLKDILCSMLNSQGAGATFFVPEWDAEVEWHPRDKTLIDHRGEEDLAGTVDDLCKDLMSVLISDKPYIENIPDSTEGDDQNRQNWPVIFGEPTQVFINEEVAFAFFERVHRLVVDKQHLRYIYDTRHFRIDGKLPVEKEGSLVFWGPDGEVDCNDLHLVSNPESTEQIAN